MDLINQVTDDSMVDTEKNMSKEIPEGEDRNAYSYRRYNKRACMYRAGRRKASDLNKFDLRQNSDYSRSC